ncbi:MAG: hypothetical protein ACI945_000195 [Pseudohongiellaceae bacterium]|jgi:uncharacterized protein YqiB (DUF1249 family)
MARKSYSVDLIKQMAECDANYIRLLKLVPQLQAYLDRSFEDYIPVNSDADVINRELADPEKILEGISVEFAIADLESSNEKAEKDEKAEKAEKDEKVVVQIRILEAFKYTTTLEITQKPQFKAWMTNPSMLVRAYHDANTAEVVSYQGHRHLQSRYAQPNPKMYCADEKMQVNAFLGEWLTHCLKVGRSMKAPAILFSTQ